MSDKKEKLQFIPQAFLQNDSDKMYLVLSHKKLSEFLTGQLLETNQLLVEENTELKKQRDCMRNEIKLLWTIICKEDLEIKYKDELEGIAEIGSGKDFELINGLKN